MIKILAFILVFLFGGVLGGGFVLFYYPFWFPPAEVNEQITNIDSKRRVATGEFIHPDPSDSVHWGKGNVDLFESASGFEIFLTDNFEVGPGPDFHIYLVDRADITDEEHFTSSTSIELGKLKSFTGSQVYAAPGLDLPPGSKSIVVWCKRFGQLITSANIGT